MQTDLQQLEQQEVFWRHLTDPVCQGRAAEALEADFRERLLISCGHGLARLAGVVTK